MLSYPSRTSSIASSAFLAGLISILVACQPVSTSDPEVGQPLETSFPDHPLIKAGMTKAEVINVLNWENNTSNPDLAAACENYYYKDGDEQKYVHIYYEADNVVVRATTGHDEPCFASINLV